MLLNDLYGEVEFGMPETKRYNAEFVNTNTGVQYLRARYYEVPTGTFASEDREPGRATVTEPICICVEPP